MRRLPIPTIDLRRVLACAGLLAVAGGSAAIVVAPVLRSHPAPATIPQRAAAAATPGPSATSEERPARLRIPAIGVDTNVESVGVTPAGNMDVPRDVRDVGWYALGVRPGRAGDAVFDGHLDWYSGPAVFWKLGQVKPGDRVEIGMADGRTLVFAVYRTAAHPFNQPPADLFGRTGAPRVSLITCTGTWDGTRYTKRLVVDAAFVGERRPPTAPHAA